jgi:hypothetical protein
MEKMPSSVSRGNIRGEITWMPANASSVMLCAGRTI